MANTRELRRRIKSIKNTSQITKAMQMVAATKMRKAQMQAVNGRPYTSTMDTSLLRLLPKVKIETHPLLKINESKTSAVLLLSTDKSLCGALNTNLFRLVLGFNPAGSNLSFYSVGKKGRSFVVKTAKNLVADFENKEKVEFRDAKQIAKMLVAAFLSNEIGEVYVAYPHFGSALRQEPRIAKILPISMSDIEYRISEDQRKQNDTRYTINDKQNSEFLFEPNVSVLLDYILTHSIDIKIYQAMLETKASEHSARMMAMQNATDNAKDLVEDLNLTYNQTRQNSITKELLEITSAQLALG